jgi:hypothetical protein
MTTVRTLLAMAFVRALSISQPDVKMPFLMANSTRRSIYNHLLGILFLMAWFVIFAILYMVLNKLLVLSFSALPL